MADEVGIYLDGTTSTRGTAAVSESGGGFPIAFDHVGQIITVYIWARDSVTLAANGKQSTQPPTVRCPAGVVASLDGGATYTSVVAGSTIVSAVTGIALMLKQTDAAVVAAAQLGIDPLTWVVSADATAPAWPGGGAALTVTPSGTSLLLDWADATDNVAVTLYSVERSNDGSTGWAEIATPGTSALTDAIGTNSTTRYYRVRAKDAAGNYSSYSAIVSGTTDALAGDSTPPTEGGTLVAISLDASVRLQGPTGADNVAVDKFQYQKRLTGAGSWDAAVDVQVTDAASVTFPATVVSGLTNEASYDFQVRVVDTSGNVSAWSATIVGVPGAGCFYNNFAAGEALNSTYLDTSVASTGAVTVASNVCTITTTAAAQAAMLRLKNSIDKTKRRRIKVKQRLTAGSTSAPAAQIGMRLHSNATIPAVWAAAGEPPAVGGMNLNHTDDRTDVSYNAVGATGKLWETSGTYANSYRPNTDARTTLYQAALSTWYHIVLEWDSSGWVWELRDASDALIFRTAKIAWTATYNSAGTANPSPIWALIGDPYTDYWSATQEVASVRCEALAADIS